MVSRNIEIARRTQLRLTPKGETRLKHLNQLDVEDITEEQSLEEFILDKVDEEGSIGSALTDSMIEGRESPPQLLYPGSSIMGEDRRGRTQELVRLTGRLIDNGFLEVVR